MNSDSLAVLFRADVVDTASPYLWSDNELYSYMDDAMNMFARLTGGIADFTSPVTAVAVTAGNRIGAIDPSILRIMSATRASDGGRVTIINSTDEVNLPAPNDYGTQTALNMSNTPGPVRYMVIGAQRGVVKFIQVPVVADTLNLVVYRLPLTPITGPSQSLNEIGAEHHAHLMIWMRHLAYAKQDAETFDRARSAEQKAMFEAYCVQACSENDRYKAKVRVVRYGGL